jgi:tetratricopeptide (TPR) repeat protein
VKRGRAKIPPRTAGSATTRWRDAATFASILCATLLAYLPALGGGLLWDDTSHLTRPELQSLDGLWRIWFDLGATQQYYPLLHSAFWMEHRLWGDAVLGYHLTNVALHAASACLVVMIVRRLSLAGAWLAGLVFALHPVCVESVAWISEQKSTLSGVFYLAAALAYLHFDRSRRVSRYWLALGLFVCALATKTVTATLPAALLVAIWWRRGRIEWKRDARPLLPWLALGAFAGLFTAWVEKTVIGAEGADYTLTLLQRGLLAGRVIWFYAGKLVWPANLTFFYPRWTVDPGEWWQYLFPAGVLAVAIGLWIGSRRQRGPLAGFLIFAGTLFPVLGFFNVYPFRFSFVADHFQYLACLGVIVPVASALAVLARRIAAGRLARIACGAVLPVLLGVLTWGQSGMYRDAETLYRETLARNPGSWLAHNNLGTVLLAQPGRLADAIAEYRAAARLEPGSEQARTNLGNALAQAGRLREAIPELEAALRIKPGYAEGHNNLGFALSQMPGGLERAIAEYQAALRINPDFAEAHYNLASAFVAMPGRLPDAIAEYQAALRTEPDLPDAHNNLGGALAQTGRLPDAIAQFEAAIRLRPDYVEAYNNLGNALSQTPGRMPDAVAEYQAALRIDPENLQAHLGLGNALAQTPGRQGDAIAEFEAALRIKPDPAVREMVERLRAELAK